MIRTTTCEVERLTDCRLMTHLLGLAELSRERPTLGTALRRFHCGHLTGLDTAATDDERLTLPDADLLRRLSQAVEAARSRPSLAAALVIFHSEELVEMRIEELCRKGARDLTPEQILAAAQSKMATTVTILRPDLSAATHEVA